LKNKNGHRPEVKLVNKMFGGKIAKILVLAQNGGQQKMRNIQPTDKMPAPFMIVKDKQSRQHVLCYQDKTKNMVVGAESIAEDQQQKTAKQGFIAPVSDKCVDGHDCLFMV
jgi:hypothetical protein